MKRIVLLIFFASLLASLNAQETTLKEYSYSQFFKLIEDEQDSVFSLKNAVVRYNAATDSIHSFNQESVNQDSTTYLFKRTNIIIINKAVKLDNVHFLTVNEASDEVAYGLHHVRFQKEVLLKNMLNGTFLECTFDKELTMIHDEKLIDYHLFTGNYRGVQEFRFCTFNKGIKQLAYSTDGNNKKINANIIFSNCTIYPLKDKLNHSNFRALNVNMLAFDKCRFKGKGLVEINFSGGGDALWIIKNDFPEQFVNLAANESDDTYVIYISENKFGLPLLGDIDFNFNKLTFDWDQLKSGIVNNLSYFLNQTINDKNYWKNFTDLNNINRYLDTIRVENEKAFREESKMLGQIYGKYKREHDIANANKSFIYLKDLETERLGYLQKTEPSFTSYFTWKINQFLKVFSSYGTQPAKAIVFSMYVILIFALIYLFFPNSWDSHGKHRIIHRYTFFMKYLNRNQGIHEVYLEDKQPELLAFHEFKDLIDNKAKTVPRFFTATALPLYKWALSGTKFTASFLSRFDVLKGTWQEVPPAHRWWKMILLIGAFLIAIAYDILIKILNALMLSINTFTTLGFGEIPIKGLPRYLAIVQGFIGWFMLTIFSVSLISQLLN